MTMGVHGEAREFETEDPVVIRDFVRRVLGDLAQLEAMIEGEELETGVRRVGAEQEMHLVDATYRPKSVAPQLLASLGDPRLTTELASFNLEANLAPMALRAKCLSAL